MKTILDPLYGMIPLREEFLPFVDSALFQRLRYIKQLSFVYLVYPSAHHTRFEHSLGTYFITAELLEFSDLKESIRLSIELYALLHDVGHSAFSHLGEKIVKSITNKKIDHEEIGWKKIEKEMKNKIDELIGWRIFKNAIKKYGWIVDGEFGTDRIDYLRRDAYYTGTNYGRVEFERIKDVLTITSKGIEIEEWHAFENLLIARAMMWSSVYFHKTVKVAERMLEEATRLASMEGFQPLDLYIMDDSTAFFALSKYKEASRIIERIRKRKLMKPVFIVEKERFYALFSSRDEAEVFFSKKAKGRVFVEIYNPKPVKKEPWMSSYLHTFLEGKRKELEKVLIISEEKTREKCKKICEKLWRKKEKNS